MVEASSSHIWRVTMDDEYVPFSDYLTHPIEQPKTEKKDDEDKAADDIEDDI